MKLIDNVDLDLLEKTYQNAAMGAIAIEEVLDKAKNENFYKALNRQLKDYREIADKSREQLVKNGYEVKEKSLYDRVMMKGNIKLNTLMDDTDSHIADMVVKGSTMGVTQMTKLLHDKVNTDGTSKQIANEFIKKEEMNIKIMKEFL